MTPKSAAVVGTLAVAAFLLGLGSGCDRSTAAAGSDMTTASRVERGRYLVTIGGCNDCHTPWVMTDAGPAPDMSRMLSGHPEDVVMPPAPDISGASPWGWTAGATNTAFAGPWGVSYAFNLTPDENTGIGIWTEDIFINTIRNGRHWGVSRPILPPMPWFNYREMTDEDLRSVYAFLRSIPPVHNRVPDAIIVEN